MKVCLLASGSNGNACYVEAGETRLLIDVGIGPRILARRMKGVGRTPQDLTHLLLTHEHVDHVSGLEGLLKRNPDVAVCATRGTLKTLPHRLRRNTVQISSRSALDLGGVTAHPFRTSHDGAQPVGFRVESAHAVLGYATDLGMFSRRIITALSGCEALIVEANHCAEMLRTGPYPPILKSRVGGKRGHLSNQQCRDLLEKVVDARVAYVTLAHLSAVNNTPKAVWAEMEDLVSAHSAVWALGSRTAALEPVILADRPSPSSSTSSSAGGRAPKQLEMEFRASRQ
jgi:phosphoribosyl 1,2-cyclic phosphodiesterase